MRRAANLFDRIPEPENLRLAFHKAARGRRGQAVVRQFAASLDQRIAAMSVAIREGTFPIGRFQQFLIRDPKERVITAPCFDERVLHHAIMNVCEPVMDRWLIDDTFACRTGKGREAAIERAQHFARDAAWSLKLDVRRFFDSVPHGTLMILLERRFKDRRLLELLTRIITAYRGELGIGLPIGSLTSQHFANFYLGWLDRFVKESLRVRGYVRYMDDMILWHDDLGQMQAIQQRCRSSRRPAGAGIQTIRCPANLRGSSISGLSDLADSRGAESDGASVAGAVGCGCWQRAERLGLISEPELQARLSALTAFAKGGRGRRVGDFGSPCYKSRRWTILKRLEPREPWRQLEQRRGELPDGEPQHERTDEPHEQQRLPPGPEFRWKGSDCPETPDGTDRFPV